LAFLSNRRVTRLTLVTRRGSIAKTAVVDLETIMADLTIITAVIAVAVVAVAVVVTVAAGGSLAYRDHPLCSPLVVVLPLSALSAMVKGTEWEDTTIPCTALSLS
jgi:hypothetical protein